MMLVLKRTCYPYILVCDVKHEVRMLYMVFIRKYVMRHGSIERKWERYMVWELLDYI
jgi:hypothetical protein